MADTEHQHNEECDHGDGETHKEEHVHTEECGTFCGKIPVTVLTGFLGAGKTTLLNWILKADHGKKLAIIENEFGQTGVDSEILVAREHSNEIIIEVENGCVCCKVRGDMIKALQRLYNQTKGQLDGVIVETTGLADPGPVCQTFFVEPTIRRLYSLDGVLTVCDSKFLLQHLNEKRTQEQGNEAEQQVAYADKILLNKLDLVSEEHVAQVEAEIKKINPFAEIIKTTLKEHGVPLDKVIGLDAFDPRRANKLTPDFEKTYAEAQCDRTVRSIGFNLNPDEQLNIFKFQAFIRRLIGKHADDLFRYKGVIAMKGHPNKYVFQGVHMLFMGDFAAPWGDEDERKSCFCFIGRNVNFMNIENGFRACIAKPLRFGIGQRVQARVGHEAVVSGEIIRTWENGNAYRVKLDNGEQVWAPMDDDHFVKAEVMDVE